MSSYYPEFSDLSPDEVNEKRWDLWNSLVVDYPTDFPFGNGYFDPSKLESGIDLSNEDDIAEGCPTIAKFIWNLSNADFGGDQELFYISYMNLIEACRERLENTIADKYRSQHLDPHKYRFEILALSSYYWLIGGYDRLEDERPERYSNNIRQTFV